MKYRFSKRSLGYALLCLVVLGILVYCTSFLPSYMQMDTPVHRNVAERYMAQAEAETGSPNMVTAVLADYRGFDTLIETSVIFTAGVVTYAMIAIRRRKNSIWGGDEDHEIDA